MIPKNKTEAHGDGIFVTKHAKNEIRVYHPLLAVSRWGT